MKKYIFVSGGVCSSLGKGVAASSIGALLEGRGLNVCMVKCDPYINVDAGTMSPHQHGEVFVCDDGAETDLDLGNYARFTESSISRPHSITTGQIYQSVITKERAGQYLGSTVQVIPHITDEIKRRIGDVANENENVDVVIIEIGGTVGDIESIPFLEAARQLITEMGRENAVSVHLTLVPEVAGSELKTKPTQHSVKAMQEMGIQPDILICRAPAMLTKETRTKISHFTNVALDSVFVSYNVDTTIYAVPLIFFDQELDTVLLKKLNLNIPKTDLSRWYFIMQKFLRRQGKVRIGIIGKYMELQDAYKSIHEALFHAGLECGVEVELVRVDSSKIVESLDVDTVLGSGEFKVDAVLVPGGFGQRGIEGMVEAVEWARTHKLPYFGICLGMQVMTIEWARGVLGWGDADSTEFSATTGRPVVSLMKDQAYVMNYGATMRLGAMPTLLEPGSKSEAAYGSTTISERHRHRFEFSNRYREAYVESGLLIIGTTPDRELVEVIEWPDHPWGVGVQFHPEFKSKPFRAHPLFRDFIAAAKEQAARSGE